jgi:hypothetical protein
VSRREIDRIVRAASRGSSLRAYAPPAHLEVPRVPENPTEADVTLAKKLIQDVLSDFPYIDNASRTNAVAFLLTPIVREAIVGLVPMCLVDKVDNSRNANS